MTRKEKRRYTNPTPTSGPKKNEKKTFANATIIITNNNQTGSSEIIFVRFLSGIAHASVSTLAQIYYLLSFFNIPKPILEPELLEPSKLVLSQLHLSQADSL